MYKVCDILIDNRHAYKGDKARIISLGKYVELRYTDAPSHGHGFIGSYSFNDIDSSFTLVRKKPTIIIVEE